MRELAPGGLWREFGDSLSDRRALGGRDCVGATQTDSMCAGEAGEWLAQRAAGEDVIEAERLERVEENDVEVTREAAVLEAIVENNRTRIAVMDSFFSGGDPIAILDVRHAGQRF